MILTTLIGGAVIVSLAMATDSRGTVHMIAAIISVRGVTWVVKKITGTVNKDASEIIDFAGWSIAGVNCIGVIKNALASVTAVTNYLGNISNSLKGIGDGINNFFDKITFWN